MREKKTIIKHTILIIVVFVCFVFFQTIIQINLLDSHVINPYSVEVRAFEKCKQIRGIEVTDEAQMTALMDSFENHSLNFSSGILGMHAVSNGKTVCSTGDISLPDEVLSLKSKEAVSSEGYRYERYDFDDYSLIIKYASLYDEDNSSQKFTHDNIIKALPMLLPVLLMILLPTKDSTKRKKRMSVGFYISLGYMLLTSLLTVLIFMHVVKIDNNLAISFSSEQIENACNDSPSYGLSIENALSEYFTEIVDDDDYYEDIQLVNSEIQINYSTRNYTNRVIEVVVQLCLLSLGFILIYDRSNKFIDETIDEDGPQNEGKILINGGKQLISAETERFYLMMFLSGFAIALPHAINIIQFKRLAELNLLENDEWILSVTMMLTTIVTMLFAFFSTTILTKIAKSFLVYFRISLSISLISMAIAAFSSNVFLYAIAIICSYIASGLSLVIPTIYSANLTDSDVVYARLKSGSQLGECIGIILGGILSANFSNETVFGCSSVLFALILISTFMMKETSPLDSVASARNSGNIFRVFKDYNAILTWILLIIPYGMIDVFVTYTMPIDVVDFGYTAVIVSGLMMLKKLISATYKKLFFVVRKKISIQMGSLIYLISCAVILVGYYYYRSIISMIIVVLLLSFFGCMGIQMLTNILYESKTRDDYSKKELGALFDVGKNLGKSAAPVCISLFGGVICIPIFTVAGVAAYSAFSALKRKRKRKY